VQPTKIYHMAKEKKFSLLSYFARITKGQRRWIALSITLSFLSSGANLLMPQSLRIAVDSAIGGAPIRLSLLGGALQRAFAGAGPARLLLLSGALALTFAAVSGLCSFGARVSLAHGTESAIRAYRDALYLHIHRLPFSWHSENPTGDIIQRATSDMNTVRGFIGSQATEVVRTAFLLVIALSFMFSMNATLSLAAVAFMPFMLAYNAVYYRLVGKRFLEADEAEGELTVIAQENFTGVRVVRAFGMEGFEKARFDGQNESWTRVWVRLGTLMGSFWGLNDVTAGLQLFAIILLGCFEAVKGRITVGEFLVFINYYYTLQWPVRSLGRTLSEMSKARVSAIRLSEIEDAAEEDMGEEGERPPMPCDIELSHVSFSYGEHEVLRDISLKIPKGTSLGILGPTGSGKSTLVSLLCRLHAPTAGCIAYGGVKIEDISLPYLRRNVGLILQEPFLFSRTMADNISIGMPVDLGRLAKAVAAAGLEETVASFPRGLDTVVGERGVTLSGGQKQRMAIARMVYRGGSTLIFDDSLSAVDIATDYEIRKNIQALSEGRTVIIISHRISSLMGCDKTVVLEGGRVSDEGTHEELIAREGLYKEIYEAQGMGGDGFGD